MSHARCMAAAQPFCRDVHPFDNPISADRALIGSWTPASFRSVQREARISEGYFALNPRCMADHSSSEVVLLAGGSESTGNGKQLLQLQHGAIRCREDRPARRLGDQRRRWRHAVLREGNQIAVAQVP